MHHFISKNRPDLPFIIVYFSPRSISSAIYNLSLIFKHRYFVKIKNKYKTYIQNKDGHTAFDEKLEAYLLTYLETIIPNYLIVQNYACDQDIVDDGRIAKCQEERDMGKIQSIFYYEVKRISGMLSDPPVKDSHSKNSVKRHVPGLAQCFIPVSHLFFCLIAFGVYI